MATELDLVAVFEHLHRHPELSHQEVGTTALIRRVLEDHHIEILNSSLKTGVIAIVRGEKAGPTVALRADIDALPITENSEVSFASVNPGVHHACGHDFHTAALLGAAVKLRQASAQLNGSVVLIFQPGEETASGAREIIDSGALAGLGIKAFFGLHVNAQLPAGTIGIKAGVLSAAVDRFLITATAEGTHGATPHLSPDVVSALTQLVASLQHIVSRRIDPFAPSVISVTRLQAGNTWNVLPSHGEIEGTVRSFDDTVRHHLHRHIAAVVSGTALATEVDLQLQWIPGPGAVINTPELIAIVEEAAAASGVPTAAAVERAGGEDFAEYREIAPSAFFLVGMGSDVSTHSPGFVADAAHLPAAVSVYLATVERFLASNRT